MESGSTAFKSREGEARFMAAYDATMRRWPAPYESMELRGRFGSTHVVVNGREGAPPLVLLHGYFMSLTMWSPNIAALCREHRLYAVDVMGQAGKSIPDRPMASRADCAEWMTSILDALRIDRACLVGMSYGGWLSLNYAILAPQRVDRLVLLSPAAGFLPIGMQFFARGILCAVFPAHFMAERFMRWMTHDENWNANRELFDDSVRQFHLGFKYFRAPKKPVPPIAFSDDELRSVRAPTLLLIGQEEVLYNPAAALERAQRLIPHLEGELVPRASHDMSMSRHEVVDARVLAFLATASRSSTSASVTN